MNIQVINNIPKVIDKIDKNNKRNLRNATILVYRHLQKSLTGKRSGNWYLIPGTSKYYQASSANPAEPPAKRTGALAKSYKFEIDENKMEGYVGSTLDYSVYLEEGTIHIKPRPHLKPAFEDNANKIKKILLGIEI